MSIDKTYLNTFNNLGYLIADLTEEELKPIKDEVNNIKLNFNSYVSQKIKLTNYDLTYILKQSYDVLDKIIRPYLNIYGEYYNYNSLILDKYGEAYDKLSNANNLLILDRPWINFSKKHDYLPPHIHKGFYSFVLWVEIPYYINKDKRQEFNINGQFQFIYTNSVGSVSTHQIPADKTYINKLIVFPSNMTHAVYPFYTSDDFRVSISGNYILKPT